jgi:hypothetical protein
MATSTQLWCVMNNEAMMRREGGEREKGEKKGH